MTLMPALQNANSVPDVTTGAAKVSIQSASRTLTEKEISNLTPEYKTPFTK